MKKIDQRMMRDVFASQGKSFRGGCIENLGNAPMGKGHDNGNQPFDIETSYYLKPIAAEYDKARREGTGRKICVLAGVKTGKSLMGEIFAADSVCNWPGDAAIYFGTEKESEAGSTTRIITYFNGDDDGFGGIPNFKEKMKALKSRFDCKIGMIRFPDKTFFILPANLSNTQQKNLSAVFGQDMFLTEKTGMIKQMIYRTAAYEKEAIIYLESQGGEDGYDFDNEYNDTNQGELHVKCPHCAKPHVFNWKAADEQEMTRPDDFMPTPPLIIPSLDHQSWIETYKPMLLSPERRVAGFQRGSSDKVKHKGGELNEMAVMRETHFQCFHCGGIWKDDGQYGTTRIHLDKSSHYVSANPNALPRNVGFNIPQWINTRMAWGPMMVNKLRANRNADEFNNFEDLKLWWQKVAGRTWKNGLRFSKTITISPSSYDPEKYKELMGDNFHSVNMIVDCQEDQDHKAKTGASITGWFWYVVRAVDKFSNSVQLARGFCKSWESWIAVQKHFGIPNDRVMIDGIFDGEGVLKKTIECREIRKRERPHWRTKSMEEEVTWKLLIADKRQTNYKHLDKTLRPFSPEARTGGFILDEKTNRPRWIEVEKIFFNKDPIRFQVDALYTRAPGMPKFDFLKREQLKLPDGSADTLTLQMETGRKTYENQMQSQKYDMTKKKYVEDSPDDHYYFCEQGFVVRAGMDGLMGLQAIFTEEQPT